MRSLNVTSKVSVNRIKQLLDLDPVTGQFRWKVSRGPARAGSVAGNKDAYGYTCLTVDGVAVKAHRAVFAITHGYWPDRVDHIDGNPANNRPENLREATAAENSMNRRRRKDSTSGVKGVVWSKKSRKWEARCGAGGRFFYVGQFDDLVQAEERLREFRQALHADFARHA